MATRRQRRNKAGQEANAHIPLLLIPNEITNLIFIECVRGLKATNVAIDISHVCRHWRSIALSLPSLWRSFWYTARHNGRAANIRAGKLFDLYLKRSQSQLLDLGFDFRKVRLGERRFGLLKKALPYAARWRRLTILAFSSMRDFLLLHLQTLFAPHLQYLALATSSQEVGIEPSNHLAVNLLPTLFKGGAPKLTFLWMDTGIWPNCLPPLSNITTLLLEKGWNSAYTSFIWTTFVEILSLPALSDLSLKGLSFDYPDTFVGIHPVVTAKLKHLRVNYNEAQPLLLLLRAPLLETLVLQNINFVDHNKHLWTFIQPADVYSFPSLHSLVLNECDISVSGTLYLSQITGNVKNVIISRIFDLYPNSIYFTWPQLEDVTLRLSNTDVRFYLAYTKRHAKKSFTCRIYRDYLEMWKNSCPTQLAVLHSICTIQEILPGNSAVWPPDSDGYFNARDENHFAISQV